MRTVRTKVFKFNELSETAKENAIEKNYYFNVENLDWWESVYEDASNVGLRLTGFDLDRNKHAKGEFLNPAPECAESIIENHGKECDTFKIAETFLNDLNQLTGQYDNIDDCPESEIDDLENEFLESLLSEYADILEKECEYLTSSEAIAESLIANEYEFTKEGNIF